MTSAQLMLRNGNEPGKLHAPHPVANSGVLPSDVLYEILLRLPANMPYHFHLVCRSWRSLTSHPTFAKSHSSRHPLIAGLHCGREIRFVDLASGNIVKRMYTEQPWDGHELSMNLGLLCVFERSGQERAFVLNPATGAITVLPTKYDKWSTNVLGQVPSTGEYKVLRIRRYVDNLQTCDVMTLGGIGGGFEDVESWRVRPCPPIQVSTVTMHRSVVNGVAYFLSTNTKLDDLASFDFATEEWRHGTLHGPLGIQLITATHDDISFNIANLNGCLVTICHDIKGYHAGNCSTGLWFLMDVDKGLWTKRYTLRLPTRRHIDGFPSPLWILDGKKILLWDDWTKALRAYDPRTNTSTDLSTVNGIVDVGIYQGNLLCSDILD